jgi:hypothetical protein
MHDQPPRIRLEASIYIDESVELNDGWFANKYQNTLYFEPPRIHPQLIWEIDVNGIINWNDQRSDPRCPFTDIVRSYPSQPFDQRVLFVHAIATGKNPKVLFTSTNPAAINSE